MSAQTPRSAASQPGCACCGGVHGPTYPLANDARLDARLFTAGTPMCLRCTCLVIDDLGGTAR